MKGIPRIKEFPTDSLFWRVDWFGAAQRNPNIPSEPSIQVVISPIILPNIWISDAKSLASVRAVNYKEQKTINIGCGQLPLVSIGSIWCNGICQNKYAGETLSLEKIDINPESSTVIEAGFKELGHGIIPYSHYRTGGTGIRSKLLAIKTPLDPYGILIPMMELIRFYYAVSTDLAHVMFSGGLQHDIHSVLNMENTGIDQADNRVIVGLRQHLSDEDGWVLGRIMTSKEAWEGATLIHDNMLKQTLNNQVAHVETRFPFNGQTTLRARCKRIPSMTSDRWRILVLSLAHCSAPFPFENLTIDRDNDNRKGQNDDESTEDQKKPAFQGAQSNKKNNGDKKLQSRQEPNKELSTETITVPSIRFGAIENKEPDKPIKDECHYKSSPSYTPASGDELGTGNGAYNGSTVGKAKINTTNQRQKALPASFDTFIAAINLLNGLEKFSVKRREPNEQTEYIPLTNPSGKWQWSYLNSKIQTRRQVLIADICYQDRWFTLIEFELRNTDKCKIGLVYFDDGQYITDVRISNILAGIADVHGVWSNVPPYKIGLLQIDSYKHVWPTAKDFADSVTQKIIKHSFVE